MIRELTQDENIERHCHVHVETLTQIAEACVRACGAHPMDLRLQQDVADLLMRFCKGEICAEQEAMVKKGVAEAMLSAMRNHSQDVEITLAASFILRFCCVRRTGEADLKRTRDAILAWVGA
jgi:hypothetical protein